jgi:hypothetical protein
MGLVYTGDNNWGQPGKWYVHPTPGLGTHTTLTLALASASNGDTIYMAPGFTYTESPTISISVEISSFDRSTLSTGPYFAIISGTLTFGGSATTGVSNLTITNNSATPIVCNAGGTVSFENCYISTSTGLGVSGAGNVFNFNNSTISTGGQIFAFTSGTNTFTYSTLITSLPSASTQSNGSLIMTYCNTQSPITTSGIATLKVEYCAQDKTSNNAIFLTCNGTGTSFISDSYINSGTAAAISIGAGATLTVSNCTLNSTNANPITGAGTLIYAGVNQIGTVGVFNTTTTTLKTISGGYYQGINTATSPPAGSIGESISSSVARASATVINNNSATTITSISLTAGIWDISAIGCLIGTLTGTQWAVSITTTTNTQGTPGTTEVSTPTVATAASDSCLSIGKVRLTFGTTTSVFVTGFALFSVGSATQYGSVIATRVA